MTDIPTQLREAANLREAVNRLLAAIDELNTAKPLVDQAAWRSVVRWAGICRPIADKVSEPSPYRLTGRWYNRGK